MNIEQKQAIQAIRDLTSARLGALIDGPTRYDLNEILRLIDTTLSWDNLIKNTWKEPGAERIAALADEAGDLATALVQAREERDTARKEQRGAEELHVRAGDLIEDALGTYARSTKCDGWLFEHYAADIKDIIARLYTASTLVEAAHDFRFEGPGGKWHAVRDGERWFVAGNVPHNNPRNLTRDEAINRARTLSNTVK